MIAAYFESAEKSDVGMKRKNNEDACLCIPEKGVFCVADGMGGEAAGDLASETIITTLQEFFAKTAPAEDSTMSERIALFRKATNEASRWIKNFAEEKAVGQMGSTLVGLVFDPRTPRCAAGLHAGDSRLYCFRRGHLKQITADHSAVAALAAKLGVDPSTIPAKYQNELSRAVGLSETTELEKSPVSVASGDLFLLCSDGLSKMLEDVAIAKILSNGDASPSAIADKLIAEANAAGGRDNVTVVVVKIGDLTNAPNPIDDEEDEDRTVAAPDSKTSAHISNSKPTPAQKADSDDSLDIHGDTPTTPSTPATIPPEKPAAKKNPDNTPVPAGRPAAVVQKTAGDATPGPAKPKNTMRGVIIATITSAILLAGGAGGWYWVAFRSKPAKPSTLPRVETNKLVAATAAAVNLQGAPATNAVVDEYLVALTNAQAAFDRRDFETTVALAEELQRKKPADARATKLRTAAEEQIKIGQWRETFVKAQSAYNNHDYNSAIEQATKALLIIPGEQATMKLHDDAQRGLAEEDFENNYQAVLKAGWSALAQKDYGTAEAKAKELLVLKANDAPAQQILRLIAQDENLDSARRYFNEDGDYDQAARICQLYTNLPDFDQIAEGCRREQTQLAGAEKLFSAGDYSFIPKLQSQTFAGKPPFLALLTQAVAEAHSLKWLQACRQTNNWQVVASGLARTELATATNKAPFLDLANWAANMKLIQDSNETYEKMLVWFNVKKPTDRSLQTAAARNETRKDMALSNEARQQYLAAVQQLEKVFKENGSLNQNNRAKLLKDLKENITYHP